MIDIDAAWNERDEATRERYGVTYEIRVYDPVHPDDHHWHPVDRNEVSYQLQDEFGIMAGRAFEVLLAGGGVGVGDLQFRVAR